MIFGVIFLMRPMHKTILRAIFSIVSVYEAVFRGMFITLPMHKGILYAISNILPDR